MQSGSSSIDVVSDLSSISNFISIHLYFFSLDLIVYRALPPSPHTFYSIKAQLRVLTTQLYVTDCSAPLPPPYLCVSPGFKPLPPLPPQFVR
jgi:hypothetical protein